MDEEQGVIGQCIDDDDVPDEWLKPKKAIRIAISGDVHITSIEREIIDTPEFQRLRFIKQLGPTYLVFPTALHSRFDHSLGTLKVADDMIRFIRENRHSKKGEFSITAVQVVLIHLYALLHDITHIPFGHTLEDELCIFDRHDNANSDRFDHFLGSRSTIGNIIINKFGRYVYDRFIKICKTNKNNINDLGMDAFIYDMISNTVCADLLDYLRRDCFFCGLNTSMDYRFLNFLYLYNSGTSKRLVIRLWKERDTHARKDLISELLRLLDNRYLLAEVVYYHHAKLIAGTMIAGAVQRYKNRINEKALWSMGDVDLVQALLNLNNVESELIESFKNRILWKCIFEFTRADVAAMKEGTIEDIFSNIKEDWYKGADNRMVVEDDLAEALLMKPGDVLIYCTDKDMNMKLAKMLVLWEKEPKELKDCDMGRTIKAKRDAICDSHRALWAVKVFINPKYSEDEERKNLIILAMEYLLEYNEKEKERKEKEYYSKLVKYIINKNSRNKGMGVSEYENITKDIVEHIVSRKNIDKRIKDIVTYVKEYLSENEERK